MTQQDRLVSFRGCGSLRKFKAALRKVPEAKLSNVTQTVTAELGQVIGTSQFRHLITQFVAVMEEIHRRAREESRREV